MDPSQLPYFRSFATDVVEIKDIMTKKHAEIGDKVSLLIATI